MPSSTFAVTGPGPANGSAFKIGDGFALTAGHVVFQASGSVSNPTITSGFTVADDYRGYEQAYLTALSAYTATNGAFPSGTAIGTMEAGLVPQDSVVINHSGNVGSDWAGLFVALDDAALTGFQGYLGTGASLQREGESTGRVTGNFVSVTSDMLSFDVMSNTNPSATHGDSGGVYLIVADGREYVVGTQSANNNTLNQAVGTRFTEYEWSRLSELVVSQLSGNITSHEPTNMAVGTTNGDELYGSGRPDIVLGRAGDDYLYGETLILSSAQIAGALSGGQVWADDRLYGGADNDTFDTGMGSDLLHGGDRAATGVTATAINADGVDSASYSLLSLADADKGVVIHVRESATLPTNFQTHSAESNFAAAVFVEDLARDQTVDTLISIEKIAATDADDTLRIDTLAGSKLAGSNGQGGLLEVDLGNQANTTPEGDILDMSRLEVGAVVNWDSQKILASFSSGTLTVKGAETLKATKADDAITVSATGVHVRGAGGNDAIDATAGNVIVDWLKGDDLDTIATNYGSLNIDALTIANYEYALNNISDPRGVDTVNFADLNMNEAELVLKNLTLIDQSTPGGTTYYLYSADIFILESATGEGINLGKAVAASSHYDLNFSAGYLRLFNLPAIVFADGYLAISEGGPNIAFRIDNGAEQHSSNMPIFSDPDVASIAPREGFENADFGREAPGWQLADWLFDDRPHATRPLQSDVFAASAHSTEVLAQALSAFGHSSGPDEGAFLRTHELTRDMGFFVD